MSFPCSSRCTMLPPRWLTLLLSSPPRSAMDIMIEEAKSVLESWGAAAPTFLLTNPKLTFQMAMLPENTEYITHGPDGVAKKRKGPDIGSYRGLGIINTRSFSIEDGAPPRDILRRRVRTAEYYRIPWEDGVQGKFFSFYDEAKDAWHRFSWKDLFRMSQSEAVRDEQGGPADGDDDDTPLGWTSTKLPNRLADANLDDVDYLMRVEMWEAMNVETLVADPWTGLRGRMVAPAAPVGGLPGTNPLADLRPRDAGTFAAMYGVAVGNMGNRNATRDARRQLVSDLKAFLKGNTMYMDPAKRGALSCLQTQTLAQFRATIEAVFNFEARAYIPAPNARFLWQSLADLGVVNGVPPGAAPDNAELVEACTKAPDKARWELVVIRPNIEHSMLGIIMGRGGVEDLGATLWGQTELSVYDDSKHGIWGMSYKYNERAIVFNHKNLIRLWDVSYDGYNGGKDCSYVDWTDAGQIERFMQDTYDLNRAYEGKSMMVMRFKNVANSEPWPSPIVFHDRQYDKGEQTSYLDGEHQHQVCSVLSLCHTSPFRTLAADPMPCWHCADQARRLPRLQPRGVPRPVQELSVHHARLLAHPQSQERRHVQRGERDVVQLPGIPGDHARAQQASQRRRGHAAGVRQRAPRHRLRRRGQHPRGQGHHDGVPGDRGAHGQDHVRKKWAGERGLRATRGADVFSPHRSEWLHIRQVLRRFVFD